MHILLVGKTGSGKSSTANTLLREKVFKTRAGASVSKVCYPKPKTIDGRQITVIDTPGYQDTDGLDVAKEISSFILHCVDGIDVIALVLTAAWRPTKETRESIEALEMQFGADMRNYLLIIITRADELAEIAMTAGEFVLDYAKCCDESTAQVLRSCVERDRVVGFNNNNKKNSGVREKQLKEFFSKADEMRKTNKGSYYTKEMLEKKMEENRKEEEKRKRRLQEEKDREKREEENFRRDQAEIEASKERQEALTRQIEEEEVKMNEERQKLAAEREKDSKGFEDYLRQQTAKIQEMNDSVMAIEDQMERLRWEAELQKGRDCAEFAYLKTELETQHEMLHILDRKREDSIELYIKRNLNEMKQNRKKKEGDEAMKREMEEEQRRLRAERMAEWQRLEDARRRQAAYEEDKRREKKERSLFEGIFSTIGGTVAGIGVGLLTMNPAAGAAAGAAAAATLKTLTSYD